MAWGQRGAPPGASRPGLFQHRVLPTSPPLPLPRNRSEREVRAAALVLQTVWGYKELRKPLEKEGWKKSDFQVRGSAGDVLC